MLSRKPNALPLSLLLALPCAVSIPCAPDAEAQVWAGAAAISVEVEGPDGEPVAGAEVSAVFVEVDPPPGPPPVTTDAQGRAILVQLAEGRWRVDIRKESLSPYLVVLRIRAGKKPEITAGPIRDAVAPPLKVKLLKVEASRSRPPEGLSAREKAKLKEEQKRRRRGDPPVAPPPPPPAPVPAFEPTTKIEEPPPSERPPSEEPPAPEAVRAELPPAEPAPPEIPPATPPAAPEPAPPVEEPRVPEPPMPEPSSEPPAAPPVTPPVPEPPLPEPPAAPPVTPPVSTPPAEPPVAPPVPEPAIETPPAEPPAQELPSPEPPVEEPPMPEPPAPEAPLVPAPEPPPPAVRMRAEVQAFTSPACPGCKPGEWAVTMEQVAPPGKKRGDCPADSGELKAALRALLDASGDQLESFTGPLVDPASGGVVPLGTEALREPVDRLLSPYLDDGSGAGCQVLAVVLPRDAKFAGYRYEARDAEGGRDCLAGEECPIGSCSWEAHPQVVKSENGTVVFSGFKNWQEGRERTALLIVYFSPPSGSGRR